MQQSARITRHWGFYARKGPKNNMFGGCALPQKAGGACRRTARRNPLLRRRGYAFQQPLYGAINNRKWRLPSCKTRAAAEQADEPDLAVF